MKLIALLPFKNEEWILPTYLQNVLPMVDQIIAIDDGSTDNGRSLLEKHEKVMVVDNKAVLSTNEHWTEHSIRQNLLALGRESGGTHFLCLDADEGLTTNFLKVGRRVIAKLSPGQKLALQWLPMWKSTTHFRNDDSIWSKIWKDFAFCDAPHLSYEFHEFGIGRTPNPNIESEWLKLKQEHGVCMHFSFSKWEHFQIKSCWYRCAELVKHPEWARAINEKYKITLDSKAYVKKLPESWLEGIPLPSLDDETPCPHLKLIGDLFQEHGVDFFKELDIWHMPEIRKLAEHE